MAVLIDRSVRLPKSEYFPQVQRKSGIAIHHTVGGSACDGTVGHRAARRRGRRSGHRKHDPVISRSLSPLGAIACRDRSYARSAGHLRRPLRSRSRSVRSLSRSLQSFIRAYRSFLKAYGVSSRLAEAPSRPVEAPSSPARASKRSTAASSGSTGASSRSTEASYRRTGVSTWPIETSVSLAAIGVGRLRGRNHHASTLGGTPWRGFQIPNPRSLRSRC